MARGKSSNLISAAVVTLLSILMTLPHIFGARPVAPCPDSQLTHRTYLHIRLSPTAYWQSPQVLGSAEQAAIRHDSRIKRGRLCHHSIQPAEWRPGTESSRANFRTLHSGTSRQLHCRNRWSGNPELLLPQDRPSQVGTCCFCREHRSLCRCCQLRARTTLAQASSVIHSVLIISTTLLVLRHQLF